MARPTDMTDDVVAKLLSAFESDLTAEEACDYAGIHRSTYYRRYKDDEAFKDKVDRAKTFCARKAKKTIKENLDDPAMARWYAERKLKNQ